MKCDKCRVYKRTRKTRAYGMKKELSWYCYMDRCYGEDYFDVNPKRERQKAKKEIKYGGLV